MKWFKHDAHSLRKAAVERLIMEYGIEGYGLYYACMEMIAGDIATDDLTFELNHDAELIAHKFKMDTIRVEKIMHRCIELRLFELADSGKLRCMKLAQMLDETTSRNPEMCKLVKNMHESGAIRDIVPIKSGDSPSRREENRLEEKRRDKNRINNTGAADAAFNSFWDTYDKKIDRDKCVKLWSKINPGAYGFILSHVQQYVTATPDKQYRKNPATYLNNQAWNNEVILKGVISEELSPEGYAEKLRLEVIKNEELFK